MENKKEPRNLSEEEMKKVAGGRMSNEEFLCKSKCNKDGKHSHYDAVTGECTCTSDIKFETGTVY